MKVIWSPHAEELLGDIVLGIAADCSVEDAIRWKLDIRTTTTSLEQHPLMGHPVPASCFATIPNDFDRLRQVFCGPYRIVYEPTDVACYIYSIRHSRMMVRSSDTSWR